MGYKRVEFASNGKEAVDKYKAFSEKPDLIIIDHQMPVMNGIDAMIEILQINKGVKIIFSSADVSMKERAISMGAHVFLNKPFAFQELLNIINDITK